MPTVKNISSTTFSLPTGQRLSPGATVEADPGNAEILGLIDGGLLALEADFDSSTHKVDDVMAWVGNDPGRAAVAVATERARPERDQRSTLIDRLTSLIEATNDDSPQED